MSFLWSRSWSDSCISLKSGWKNNSTSFQHKCPFLTKNDTWHWGNVSNCGHVNMTDCNIWRWWNKVKDVLSLKPPDYRAASFLRLREPSIHIEASVLNRKQWDCFITSCGAFDFDFIVISVTYKHVCQCFLLFYWSCLTVRYRVEITSIKNSSLKTYCWCSAFQLSVAGINQFALLTTNSNCGVLTEAETFHCQQCASWEKNKRRWYWAIKWITILTNFIFIAHFIWKRTPKFKKHKI